MKESLEENIISTKPPDFKFTFIITIYGPLPKMCRFDMKHEYEIYIYENHDIDIAMSPSRAAPVQ